MSEVVSESANGEGPPDVNGETVAVESSTTQEQPPEPEGSLPLDQVFGILKNQRRRRVLKYLREKAGQVSLSELAEQIAAWENDKDVGQISSGERKRVYVGLYQCHLPKMDSMDVVDFNKPRGIIEPGENADVLYEYIERADEDPAPPWHRYSAALSVGGAAMLGSALVVDPMMAIPVVDAAIVAVVGVFLVYALACLNWERTNEADDDLRSGVEGAD